MAKKIPKSALAAVAALLATPVKLSVPATIETIKAVKPH